MAKVNVKKNTKIISCLMIIVGTGILAFGIACLFAPLGLVTGGFSGLGIVVKDITSMWWDGGIPLWFTNIALNVPVFIVGYFVKGKEFIGKTILGTIMLSVWLYIIPTVDFAQGDYMIAAIFGGAACGLGIGLVIKTGATTGGTDMVSAIIQMKLRHYSIVQILQVIDALIVLLGLFVFGIRPALYAIIGIVVSTKVSDIVVEGLNYSKGVYIVTNQHEIVAERIMKELERGVTGLQAKGMYTGTEKCVLYCVMSQKEVVNLKALVAEVDPHAFVIVSDVREVLGEGFQEYSKEF